METSTDSQQRNIGVHYDQRSRTFSYGEFTIRHAYSSIKASLDQDVAMSGSQFSTLIDMDPADQSDEDSSENKALQRVIEERTGRKAHRDRLSVPSTADDAEEMMKENVTVRISLNPTSPSVLTPSVHGLRRATIITQSRCLRSPRTEKVYHGIAV